jgi:hypothetical protein
MKRIIAFCLGACLFLACCSQIGKTETRGVLHKSPEPTVAAAQMTDATPEPTSMPTPVPVKERPYTGPNATPDIELIEVDSTCFSRIGYDFESEILALEFHKSGLYYYYDVPSSVYIDFRLADSLGGWYNAHIKGFYECEKIS